VQARVGSDSPVRHGIFGAKHDEVEITQRATP
jgi:hypothetical protein